MKSLFLLIVTFSLSSCGTIPDFTACGDLTRGRGYCTTVLSHKEQIIEAPEWAKIKLKAVKVPAKDYGKVKKYIIKQCKNNDYCSEKYGITINGTFEKLDKVTK